MKISGRIACSLALVTMLGRLATGAQTFSNDQALLQFQRAADSYAFGHRQAERRGGVPSRAVEGTLFTPLAAAAFRSRIATALKRAGCSLSERNDRDFVVPGVNAPSAGTGDVPTCVALALPKLPPELEYRRAGVALLLADAHLHVVVDVLHAAFPSHDN
jgi:hypothetical protein